MSEASRQRRLFLENRLEEIASRHGPPELPAPAGIECDPSWGPLGSLLRRTEPGLAAHLAELDAATNALERQRAASAEPQAPGDSLALHEPDEPPADRRVVATPEPLQNADQPGVTLLPPTRVHRV